MIKSSLLEIIRTFTPKELTKFEDFVNSPFFNKNNNVANLFSEIKKYAPEFKDENLEKERVWARLFADKKYNYGIMKNLIFDLSKLVEKFIMNLKFNNDEYKQNEYIIKALLDRQLHKLYLNKQNAIDENPDVSYLDKNGLSVHDHIIFMRDIYFTKLMYLQEFDSNTKTDKLQYDINSNIISNILVELFLQFSMVVANNHSRNFELEENPFSILLELIAPKMADLMKTINKNSHLNSVYVEVYYLMYLCLKEKTESSYLRFKKFLFANSGILSKYDLQTLHYCLQIIFLENNIRSLNPHKEVLEIYDSLINNNVMTTIRNDIIPVYIFNNYIYKCFLISDSAKIKTFASRFINKLDPKWVESSGNYVEFLISFINKDFNKALSYLTLIDIPYFTQKINLKYLKARCLFEIREFEMFLNEFDNLKHFVKNNNFVNEHHEFRLNKYFTIVKKLFELSSRFDKYEFDKLKKDVLETYDQSEHWLIEKLEQLNEQ